MKKCFGIFLVLIIISISGVVIGGSDELPLLIQNQEKDEIITQIEDEQVENVETDDLSNGEILNDEELRNEISEIVKTDADENIMLFDRILDIKGEAKDLIMAAGSKIDSKAHGSYAFMAGNSLNISGEIFNDTFVVGNDIIINGNIGRDLYTLGNNISISGVIGRDVYAGGEELSITGQIGGDVKFAGDTVFISSNAIIDGDVSLTANSIEIRDGATINGVITYNSDASDVIMPNNIGAEIRQIEKAKVVPAQNEIVSTIKSIIWWTISNFILFAIIMAICPKLFNRIESTYADDTSKKFFSSAGWGLLSIIIIPIVSLLAIFTIVGASIGILGLIIYTLLFMIATVISSYALSTTVLENIKNKYLKGLVGIAIVEILMRLPVIGVIIGIIVNVIAFGTIIKLISTKDNEEMTNNENS